MNFFHDLTGEDGKDVLGWALLFVLVAMVAVVVTGGGMLIWFLVSD